MSEEEEKPTPEVTARNRLVQGVIEQQLGSSAPRMTLHVPDGMARADLFGRTSMPAEEASTLNGGWARLEALKQRIESAELRDLCDESWRRPLGRCPRSPYSGQPACNAVHLSRRFLKGKCAATAWDSWTCAHGEEEGPSCPRHAPALTPQQRTELRDAEIEELNHVITAFAYGASVYRSGFAPTEAQTFAEWADSRREPITDVHAWDLIIMGHDGKPRERYRLHREAGPKITENPPAALRGEDLP